MSRKPSKPAPIASRRKLKKTAEDLLHMAGKVYHFRRDRMSPQQLAQLEAGIDALRQSMADPESGTDRIQSRLDALHGILQEVGGRIYPRNFWNDNVEMVLVAAILVIGIRTFFAQPFIIPTNSMFPSYNGLTWKLYQAEERPPSMPWRTFRLATLGARHRSVSAPAEGEVLIPVFSQTESRPGSGEIRYRLVRGLIFGVWPGTVREYTFLVGPRRAPATVRVPRDFPLDDIVREAFLSRRNDGSRPVAVRQDGLTYIQTGVRVNPGDPILRFDILLGDMLFVDRLSYHFRRPAIGHPFVFRTRHIDGLRGPDGRPEDKYYIKRLVGAPGDALRIDPPVLLRNQQPITGASAFDNNARQIGDFQGYSHANPTAYVQRVNIPLPPGAMLPGHTVHIPPHHYYAMGDNSDHSLDSRSWGFVPEHAVIGRAVFIYYPFSRHWGPAR